MSNITLFENNPLANSDLFKQLLQADKNLIGAEGGGTRRISFKGMKFRKMQGGEQLAVSNNDTLNVVILDVAPLSRTYYAGEYDAEATAGPKCWSSSVESNLPSPDVPADQRMSTSCKDCAMNVRGSGLGDSRACRFNQKLAVAIEEEGLDKVWSMQIPAASIFGEAKGRNMPLKAYARYLHNHEAPSIAVVTQLKFDENSSVPKLYFNAIRPLTAEELETALELKDSSEARTAVTMSFSSAQQEVVTSKPAAPRAARVEAEVEVAAVVEVVEVEEVEEVKEPTKVASKKATPPEVKSDDLGSIIDDWDD
jgi:hypothetical protein